MSLADIQSMKALKKLKDIAQNQITSNLFNANDTDFLDGYLLNLGSAMIQNASYFTSGYIPVNINTQYIISNVRSFCFYDVNKSYVSGDNLNGGKSNTVISVYDPSTIKYMRFSATTSTLTGAFVYKVPVQQRSKLFLKQIVVLGDSLTGQGYWQPYLRRKFGAYTNSYGVGGTQVTDSSGTDTTAMCRDERINAMLSFCDYCIFLGGTNDWAHSIPLGTISDTATNTFYGALNAVANKLTTKYSNGKIIFVAPPYSLMPGYGGWSDTTGKLNNLGLSIADYGDCTKAIARKYGIPFVDLYEECGWNSINISNFMQADTNAYIHPINGSGAERVAIAISNRIEGLADMA